ncbi:hypothetical protein [Desulfopila sp. IMCC35008]|nr:hypothetical protein [Desulfopila sp. IMCC35008]
MFYSTSDDIIMIDDEYLSDDNGVLVWLMVSLTVNEPIMDFIYNLIGV